MMMIFVLSVINKQGIYLFFKVIIIINIHCIVLYVIDSISIVCTLMLNVVPVASFALNQLFGSGNLALSKVSISNFSIDFHFRIWWK